MKLYLLKTNVQNGGVRGWNEEDQLQQSQLVVAKTTSLKFNATEAKRGNHDWFNNPWVTLPEVRGLTFKVKCHTVLKDK